MNRVMVDVTQFSRQPARSGVQRALGELACAWPTTWETKFFVRGARGIELLQPHEFGTLVRDFFRRPASQTDRDWLADRIRSTGMRASFQTLDDTAILLPEPTYDLEVLADLTHRSRVGQVVGAVVFDAFPMTHPWAFAGNGHAANSPYFRFLARVPMAFATSDSVADTLVGRLRRSPDSTPVAWLGTDHVGATSGKSASRVGLADFLMLGTVEPRKRMRLAVAALDRVLDERSDVSLTLVGRPGWEEPQFLAELERRSSSSGSVRWLKDASDSEVSELLSQATALLSLGDEGFGLPVVEALRHGCPVVYGGQQPVASLVDGRGAWAVEDLSVSGVARTLRAWCEPDFAAQRRDDIALDGLPTWQQFATTIAETLARKS